MKKHSFRITVEHLADAHGGPPAHAPLQFEARNHDDILRIVERLRSRGDFSTDDATSLAVGLKLFSEVMLDNKQHPLFTAFKPHFLDFMKTLKQGIPAA